MNEKLERYKQLANSAYWMEMKEIVEDIIKEIRDVSNVEDIKGMTGYNVSLGSLFLGKLIASKKLQDIVKAIDSLKDREPSDTTEDFE